MIFYDIDITIIITMLCSWVNYGKLTISTGPFSSSQTVTVYPLLLLYLQFAHFNNSLPIFNSNWRVLTKYCYTNTSGFSIAPRPLLDISGAKTLQPSGQCLRGVWDDQVVFIYIGGY